MIMIGHMYTIVYTYVLYMCVYMYMYASLYIYIDIWVHSTHTYCAPRLYVYTYKCTHPRTWWCVLPIYISLGKAASVLVAWWTVWGPLRLKQDVPQSNSAANSSSTRGTWTIELPLETMAMTHRPTYATLALEGAMWPLAFRR